jgi:hypothetical protein
MAYNDQQHAAMSHEDEGLTSSSAKEVGEHVERVCMMLLTSFVSLQSFLDYL